MMVVMSSGRPGRSGPCSSCSLAAGEKRNIVSRRYNGGDVSFAKAYSVE